MADLLKTSKDEIRILSFGGGVDSSAILLTHLEVEDLGIDHVIFSDTGAESKGTYENVERFQRMCSNHNIPFTIVRKDGETITEWVTRLGIVPVMAGGSHVCSVKFKGEVIHKWVAKNFPGKKITYLIGIEADEMNRKQRFTKPKGDKSNYEYPLIDRGMTRQDCVDLLESFGLSVPKSSCVFCPFMSEAEIKEVRKDRDDWATVQLVEKRFEEESSRKHQAWIDAGKPLNKGGRCFKGHWRKNPWEAGTRLFIRKVDGKQLSVAEWEQRVS